MNEEVRSALMAINERIGALFERSEEVESRQDAATILAEIEPIGQELASLRGNVAQLQTELAQHSETIEDQLSDLAELRDRNDASTFPDDLAGMIESLERG